MIKKEFVQHIEQCIVGSILHLNVFFKTYRKFRLIEFNNLLMSMKLLAIVVGITMNLMTSKSIQMVMIFSSEL